MTKSAAVKVVTKKNVSKKNVVPASVKVEAKPSKAIKKEKTERPKAHYMELAAFHKFCDKIWAAIKEKVKGSGIKAEFNDQKEKDYEERRARIAATRVAVAYRKYSREDGSVIGIPKKLCFNANRYGGAVVPEMRKTGAVGFNPETFKVDVWLKDLLGDEKFVTRVEHGKNDK